MTTEKVTKSTKVTKEPKVTSDPGATEVVKPKLVTYTSLDDHFEYKTAKVVTDKYLIDYKKLKVPGTENYEVRVYLPEDTEKENPVYVRMVGRPEGDDTPLSFGYLG